MQQNEKLFYPLQKYGVLVSLNVVNLNLKFEILYRSPFPRKGNEIFRNE